MRPPLAARRPRIDFAFFTKPAEPKDDAEDEDDEDDEDDEPLLLLLLPLELLLLLLLPEELLAERRGALPSRARGRAAAGAGRANVDASDDAEEDDAEREEPRRGAAAAPASAAMSSCACAAAWGATGAARAAGASSSLPGWAGVAAAPARAAAATGAPGAPAAFAPSRRGAFSSAPAAPPLDCDDGALASPSEALASSRPPQPLGRCAAGGTAAASGASPGPLRCPNANVVGRRCLHGVGREMTGAWREAAARTDARDGEHTPRRAGKGAPPRGKPPAPPAARGASSPGPNIIVVVLVHGHAAAVRGDAGHARHGGRRASTGGHAEVVRVRACAGPLQPRDGCVGLQQSVRYATPVECGAPVRARCGPGGARWQRARRGRREVPTTRARRTPHAPPPLHCLLGSQK